MFKRVVVCVSGGVDSAVTAMLLKSKGYNVTAAFMKNWDVINEVGECQVEKDFEDAKWVCNKLQIPMVEVNFVKDYWNEVFSNLLENYEIGNTPNPDILCNKKIKFNKFFNYARNELGADAVATGHYADNSFGSYLEYFDPTKDAILMKAKDSFKDQTFFLSQISQTSLKRTMFPLAKYLKKDVKRMAQEAGLNVVVKKKESMGICFIGNRHFQEFIVEYLENKPGNFIDLETGCVIGTHNGIHHWTLGQCCRIGGMLRRYFIYRKDVENNIIYVVPGTRHQALFSDFLIAHNIHWIRGEPKQLSNGVFHCDFKFQHTKPLVPCKILKINNKLFVSIGEPQRALTSGQFVVFYFGKECLGSAEIIIPGPSYYFLDKEVKKSSVYA